MERGREQPPGSAAAAVPRPARRVAHAPVPVSQTAIETVSDLRAVCECVVSLRTRRRSRTECTALSTLISVSVLGCVGHHMISVELCSTSSRLSLRSTLRASALTTPARSSKVALM